MGITGTILLVAVALAFRNGYIEWQLTIGACALIILGSGLISAIKAR